MISEGMAEVLRSLRLSGVNGAAQASARALGAEGVALSVLVGPDRLAEPLWCHSQLSARFEELQFTLGEGPAPDAIRTGAPVLEPDLARVRPERWPALLPAARKMGVHGVCCFPLGIGAIRVGVLTMLCDRARPPDDQQYADATALAAALTMACMDGEHPDRRNNKTPGLHELHTSFLHRAAVHQATGMISVQLGVPMEIALLRLRAHAYSGDRPLGEVAQDVVARRLRFNDDKSGPHSPDGGKG
ncbi:GAF and ANTAR domain-containing protein [Streptomyces sp. NPDC047461]|uniref:GAF and ANTAR domain-containing protein n=1 Tax=Streptomyces sp. NPDC047461 TaxID=3155619 RepID=UPI0033BFF5BC